MKKFKVGDRIIRKMDGYGFVPIGFLSTVVKHPETGNNAYQDKDGDFHHVTDKVWEKYEHPDATFSTAYPAYFKDVSTLDTIDVYAVHKLFNVDDPSGAIQHASKKLLLSGVRTGGKSKVDDVREARDALTRWLELEEGK